VTINLDGIKTIGGDLKIVNTVSLTTLEANDLQTISGSFTMTNLTTLGSLTMPELNKVGTIAWTTLPALQELTFAAEVTEADNVLITDTQLSSLEGINLETATMFNINNNRYLQKIELQLGNVSQALAIEFNAANVAVSLPNLVWANNITLRDCGSVTMPSLAAVNGSLGVYNNTLSSFGAANLTKVGGSLSFVDNSELTNITLPLLTTVSGTFQIANNTEIKTINGFPKLSVVAGAVDFNGNFTK
jgi:hypothetical protein